MSLECSPNGSGTVRSGAGAVAIQYIRAKSYKLTILLSIPLGRPMKTGRAGAPGQLLTPTAPANWMLIAVNHGSG